MNYLAQKKSLLTPHKTFWHHLWLHSAKSTPLYIALIRLEISHITRWWCLKCVVVYLARDIPAFVMYCVNGASSSSLLIVYLAKGIPYPSWMGASNEYIFHVAILAITRCRVHPTGIGCLPQSFLSRAMREEPKKIGCTSDYSHPLIA